MDKRLISRSNLATAVYYIKFCKSTIISTYETKINKNKQLICLPKKNKPLIQFFYLAGQQDKNERDIFFFLLTYQHFKYIQNGPQSPRGTFHLQLMAPSVWMDLHDERFQRVGPP